jgi:putative membrane protein
MARFALTPADRDRITAAVAQAEWGTDGEIVTIVAAQSDRYNDVPLQFAVLAMLLVTALAALDWRWLLIGGDAWAEPDFGRALLVLLVVQTAVFLIVRYLVGWAPVRVALTPRATRRRRVRRRALLCFKVGAENRTQAKVGILLYLSTDERMAEIVADAAIHSAVPAERWGDAMAALVAHVREGRSGDGMVAAVAAIGAILSETFPKTAEDVNELPDRVIEL